MLQPNAAGHTSSNEFGVGGEVNESAVADQGIQVKQVPSCGVIPDGNGGPHAFRGVHLARRQVFAARRDGQGTNVVIVVAQKVLFVPGTEKQTQDVKRQSGSGSRPASRGGRNGSARSEMTTSDAKL